MQVHGDKINSINLKLSQVLSSVKNLETRFEKRMSNLEKTKLTENERLGKKK